MSSEALWIEPFCGSAAVALVLAGGVKARPPIAYMGSKRRFAQDILRVLGLQPGQGAAGYLLSDAGPWGAVWNVILQPGGAEAVASELRLVGTRPGEETPLEAWRRAVRLGWGALDAPEQVALWMTAQGGAWHRTPIFEQEGRVVARRIGSETTLTPAPQPDLEERGLGVEGMAHRTTAAARWLLAAGWAYRRGQPESSVHPGITGSTWAAWAGRAKPQELARRVAAVPFAAQAAVAMRCRAEDLPIPEALPDGSVVYLDPPYAGTTGYGASMSREGVLELARAWALTGATVAISEAVGLAGELGPGWREVDITSHHKNGMNHGEARMEWITMNREPAWRPSVQVWLFGGER